MDKAQHAYEESGCFGVASYGKCSSPYLIPFDLTSSICSAGVPTGTRRLQLVEQNFVIDKKNVYIITRILKATLIRITLGAMPIGFLLVTLR